MLMHRTSSRSQIFTIALLTLLSLFAYADASAACQEEGCTDTGSYTDPNGLQGGGEGLFLELFLSTENDESEDSES